jgi:lysophospholipase L1-like esterase
VRISEKHGIVRSSDVEERKTAGTFRIVVLGDSIAAAHPIRVGRQPSFADELERRLNERGGRTEVLDFGTDGYGALQEARLLETRVSDFEPDLVLVEYCLNDPVNSYTPTVWFLDGKEPRSYLVDLIRRRLGRTPSELSPSHPRYTHGAIDWDRLYDRDGPAWQNVRQAFRRFAGWSTGHNVPVVLALFPLILDREPSSERQRLEGVYSQVREEAGTAGLPLIDLGPAFAAQDPAALRLLPGDPIHPGPLGHAVAATALLAGLDARHLLP